MHHLPHQLDPERRPALTVTAHYPASAEPAGVEVSDGSDSPFTVNLPPGVYRSRYRLFGRHVYYRIGTTGQVLSARRPTTDEADEQVIVYLADLRDSTRQRALSLVRGGLSL